MDKSPVRGVHFVGSIPLSSTEEVFRTVAPALRDHIRRIPDGETGVRKNFVMSQVFVPGEPQLLRSCMNPDHVENLTEEEQTEMFNRLEAKVLETNYDHAALSSYEDFKKLREEGIIPSNVRFQVALPSVVSVVSSFWREEFSARFEPIYQRALLRALHNVQNTIPAEDLAIQWDCPLEFAILEQAPVLAPLGDPNPLKVWFDPVFDGLVARVAALAAEVRDDVELGFHLCYGDLGNKHFIEPTDTGLMVKFAMALLEQTKRQVAWIHLPVPKSRTDSAYFEPLRPLVAILEQDGTELSLGLVHYNDLDGTRERIRIASSVCPSFSVSTECGMGRLGGGEPTAEKLSNVLDICRTVS